MTSTLLHLLHFSGASWSKLEQPNLLHLLHLGGAKWSKLMPSLCSTCSPLLRGAGWSGAVGEVEKKVEQWGGRMKQSECRAPANVKNLLQLRQMAKLRTGPHLPYFEQLASERRVIRYKRRQPSRRFERILGRRAESLDALVDATAARQPVQINFDQRAAELAAAPMPAPPRVIRSEWMRPVTFRRPGPHRLAQRSSWRRCFGAARRSKQKTFGTLGTARRLDI